MIKIWLEFLYVIIACHMFGDYVLQCDYIAKSKGSNWYNLLVHSFLYTVPFAAVYGINWRLIPLLASHIIIDACKARYNKITYYEDQALHYIIGILCYLK